MCVYFKARGTQVLWAQARDLACASTVVKAGVKGGELLTYVNTLLASLISYVNIPV